ncbi:MAG TPA: aminoglycoside phosphotransferase family protein [Caulobacteraceae bacterium]
MTDIEEPLYGGLENGRVVRVGDTVRRPAGAWTATTQALLKHLAGKGFPSPRPPGLEEKGGLDEKGREILSFLPGRAGLWPWPPALLAESGPRQVGRLLKAYHQAVADFAPPAPAVWRHGPQDLAPGQIVLHGDFGPYNLVWTGESPLATLSGVIDFELARPGDALEDAAFAAIRVAHLRPDATAAKVGFATIPDRQARLAAFAEGYGCAPGDLLANIIPTQEDELRRIILWGGEGREPWATFLRKGLAGEARAELAWMEDNLGGLAAGRPSLHPRPRTP